MEDMNHRKLFLLLGGSYHDFSAFDTVFRDAFHDYEVESSYDPDSLERMNDVTCVVLYTCYVEPGDEGLNYLEGITDAATDRLVEWVQAGGGLVVVHSASTIRDSNKELIRLVGGRFISHPPRFPFCVYPMGREHPVTRGVGPFVVTDELYTQEYGDVEVHMIATDRGVAQPMVWTRLEGEGRVVHLAPGHDRAVWETPAYRRLLRQGVEWAGK